MPVSLSTSVQTLPIPRSAAVTEMLPIKERQLTAIDHSESSDLADQKARLREAANDFEAIFIRQLLGSMRSTLTEGGMFGDGMEGEVYSSFMDEAIAVKVAERGGLGLGDIIYNRMVKIIDPSENTTIMPGMVVPAKDYAEF